MTDAKNWKRFSIAPWQYGWRPGGLAKDADGIYRAEGTGDHLRVLSQVDVANTTEIHEDQVTVIHVHTLLFGGGLRPLTCAIGERADGETVQLTGNGVNGIRYHLQLNNIQYKLIAQNAMVEPTLSAQFDHIHTHLRVSLAEPMYAKDDHVTE